MERRLILIGTRGSALALKQSRQVQESLSSCWPSVEFRLKIIKTTGDKITDVPLAKIGGKGLFVKEIEQALIRNEIDLAVHSIKDVPSMLPSGLTIGAIPRREDPRDVLIATRAGGLLHLPKGAIVGTSSLRRSAQLLGLRSDLKIVPLRGNLETRLRKLREGFCDAVVLAAAGLYRMGLEGSITEYFDPEVFVPAVGQGALGIEVRADDHEILEFITPLHDPITAARVEAERSFLAELQGGCQVPIGGYARLLSEEEMELIGLVASSDGKEQFRVKQRGRLSEATELGRKAARELLSSGAGGILEQIL